MAYSNFVFTVATADELNAAIANIDAIGKAGNNNGLSAGDYTIKLTADITLGTGVHPATYAAQNADGTTGAALTIESGTGGAFTVAGSSQLYALNLTTGTTVTIDGSDGAGGSYTLDGANAYNGFFVYNGTVDIQDLTIANTVAQGGAGGAGSFGGGGGGAGLGGGLFVAGTGNVDGYGNALTTGGDVTLTNVSFTGARAVGGAGGAGSGGGLGVGGGGLQGGAGNVGGGGVGLGANNGYGSGGAGIILGAAQGGTQGGAVGGAFGGAGGNNEGGGVGATNGQAPRPGGFGGGGGQGGTGGFGGGGGYGQGGGFGGGGGGNSFGGGGSGGFGAGAGNGNGGGGGLGAGGDVFVQAGGKLTIGGTGSLGAGTVTGGPGGGGGGAGQGVGSGIFIQGNQAVTLAPGAGHTTTVAGVIADQGGNGGRGSLVIGLSADPGGTVVLAPVDAATGATRANTYSGGTTVTAGATVSVAADSALGASPSQSAPAGLTLGAGTLAIAADGFASGRTVTLGTGGGTVQVAAGSATLSGQVVDGTGAGGLTKTGIGTLTLSSGNTYTGGTMIEAGTLVLGSGRAAGTGAISFDAATGKFVELVITSAADPGAQAIFANTLNDFSTGALLDIAGYAYTGALTQVIQQGNGLQVFNNSESRSFVLSGEKAASYGAASDGKGGTLIGTASIGHVSVTAGATYSSSDDRDIALIDYGASVNAAYIVTTRIVDGLVQVAVDNGTVTQSLALGTGKQAVELDFSTNKAAVTLTGGAYGDSLKGGSGNDILDGGRGIDTMAGGDGRDTYIVRDTKDAITETASGGIDTVKATASYTLDANLERLFLAGSGSIDGTGNGDSNYVTGNAGANHIDGKAGADILTGLGGHDTFVFSTTLGAGNIDRITDFHSNDDLIGLGDSVFQGLAFTGTNGRLASGEFAVLTAQDVAANNKYGENVHIIYRADKGALYYDADGYGGDAKAVAFAVLDGKPALSVSDFISHHDIVGS